MKNIIKRIISVLTATMMLIFSLQSLSLKTNAEDTGKCGPYLYWNYENSSKTLTISGKGPMYNYLSPRATDNGAPWAGKALSKIVVEEGCTTIGDYAFSYLNFTEAVFPENSLKEIGQYAFTYSRKIDRLIFPDSLETVGKNAFQNCDRLVLIDFGDEISEIPSDACYGNAQLRSVKFGKKCKTLSYNAFYECENLVDIDLSSLETIGIQCFYNCSSLKEAHLGENIKSIGRSAFGNCTSLETITFDAIPESIHSTFNYGTPDYNERENGLYTICDGKILLSKNPYKLSITEYTVPDGVETVSGYCFNQIGGLKTVYFPDSVKNLSDDCFYNANNLDEISIPSGIEYFGKNCFERSYLNSMIPCKFTVKSRGCNPTLEKYCSEISKSYECEHSYSRKTVIEPTCETGGYTINECTVCLHHDGTQEYLKPKGHLYITETIGNSCKEGSATVKRCTVCNTSETVYTTAPKEHMPEETWSILIEPTCSKQGYIAKLCIVCGEIAETLAIEKINHSVSDISETIIPSTCTEDGIGGFKCLNCNEYFNTYTIKSTGHSFGEYVNITYNDKNDKNAAFCIRTCKTCGISEGKWFNSDGNEVDYTIAAKSSSKYLFQALSTETTCDVASLDYNTDGIISTRDSFILKNIFSADIPKNKVEREKHKN